MQTYRAVYLLHFKEENIEPCPSLMRGGAPQQLPAWLTTAPCPPRVQVLRSAGLSAKLRPAPAPALEPPPHAAIDTWLV